LVKKKVEGERSLVRPRHGCEESIKMDLEGTGWEHSDWINVDQNRDW
jgi:hypothetical protein